MNMIATGGYGGIDGTDLASINWSKSLKEYKFSLSKKAINFTNEIIDISFKTIVKRINFTIEMIDSNFKMNTKTINFNTEGCSVDSSYWDTIDGGSYED